MLRGILDGRRVADMKFIEGIDQEYDPALLDRVREENNKRAFAKARQERIKVSVAQWLNSVHSEHACLSFDTPGFIDKIRSVLTPVGREELNNYLEKPTKFLVLHGDTGLAKTSLAVALGTHLIQQGVVESADLVLGSTMLDSFSQYNPFSRDGQINPVKHYSEVDFLVMDDIGVGNEKITATQEQRLSAVIDNRWGEGKPTIITTNMAINTGHDGLGLDKYFTRSTWNRIIDDSHFIHFSGESFRARED